MRTLTIALGNEILVLLNIEAFHTSSPDALEEVVGRVVGHALLKLRVLGKGFRHNLTVEWQ